MTIGVPVGGTMPMRELARRWKWLLALGVLSVAGGIFAIVVPVAASISAAILAGWALLFGAGAQVLAAFRARSGVEIAERALLGVLCLVAGLYLLLFPVSGTITLTVVLVAFLFASGAVRLVAAWRASGAEGAGWLASAGLVSIVLGILIWADLPSSAAWAIGLLIGIELLLGGWDLIFLAFLARRAGEPVGHVGA